MCEKIQSWKGENDNSLQNDKQAHQEIVGTFKTEFENFIWEIVLRIKQFKVKS